MIIIKEQINIIQNYTNIKNLYNFLCYNEKIEYICDICKIKCKNITEKNKILYEICNFNNNISKIQKNMKLNLEELFIINKINYYDIKYHNANLILCNLCIYNQNKKSFNVIDRYDGFDKNAIFEFISFDFFNYIKLNNFYFIKDNNKNIKRIFFHNKKSLYLKYININNLDNINKLSKKNYNILNSIIQNDFLFDIEYLNKFINKIY